METRKKRSEGQPAAFQRNPTLTHVPVKENTAGKPEDPTVASQASVGGPCLMLAPQILQRWLLSKVMILPMRTSKEEQSSANAYMKLPRFLPRRETRDTRSRNVFGVGLAVVMGGSALCWHI